MRTVHYRAAGGVVVDGDKVLVLRRPARGEVRLPKGHVDEGEQDEEAARREVVEESGYADLELAADLGEQRVEFILKGAVRIERDERYFLFRLTGPTTVHRHVFDHQFEPDWLGWDEALEALTFEPEREWVRRARAAAGESVSRSRRGRSRRARPDRPR